MKSVKTYYMQAVDERNKHRRERENAVSGALSSVQKMQEAAVAGLSVAQEKEAECKTKLEIVMQQQVETTAVLRSAQEKEAAATATLGHCARMVMSQHSHLLLLTTLQ